MSAPEPDAEREKSTSEILGAGLLGGYTTFSTAMLDTVALWRDGERPVSAFNAVGMLLLGLLAATLGLALGSVL